MKILGVIAEYDPFHNGHLYHLSEAIRLAEPDLTFVALSPCLKQRGELSLLSPSDRAFCALSAGADAVFSLPVCWTVRDAEHYALGAVSRCPPWASPIWPSVRKHRTCPCCGVPRSSWSRLPRP